MISSVSRVSFGDNAINAHQALIDSPGKFTRTQQTSQPAMMPETSGDEPKKHTALKTIGKLLAAVVLVGAGLYGLSKGVKVKEDTTNIFRKGINKLVKAGEWIGEKVGGLFKKGSKAADKSGGDKGSGEAANLFA